MPNRIVVVDHCSELYPEDAPVVSTVVAGGGVVGRARASEAPSGVSEAEALAAKYVELGDFYFRADRFEDAAGAYGKARHYAPNDGSVHFVLADAVFATGDYAYAAFLIAEGLRLSPGLAASVADKRSFYSDPVVFERQQAALATYCEKYPDDAQAHLVRGYNLRFSGQTEAARAAFTRALEIDPDHRAAAMFMRSMVPPAASGSGSEATR